MPTTLVHLDAKQKALLARRAKLHGHSFSDELQYAIDLYLLLSPAADKELELLARAANKSAKRSGKRLDKTIAYLKRGLDKIAARRRLRQQSQA
jgi:hypothetical protein